MKRRGRDRSRMKCSVRSNRLNVIIRIIAGDTEVEKKVEKRIRTNVDRPLPKERKLKEESPNLWSAKDMSKILR